MAYLKVENLFFRAINTHTHTYISSYILTYTHTYIDMHKAAATSSPNKIMFVFCKELCSLNFLYVFFLLLSLSFIGAVQLDFHTTLMLSAIVTLSEYDRILVLST